MRGHLDIRDEQYAENKDGRTMLHHIISRLSATGVQKERFGRSKIQLHILSWETTLKQLCIIAKKLSEVLCSINMDLQST